MSSDSLTAQWLVSLLVACVAALVMIVPGIIVGLLARLRGLALVAVAPVIGASVVAVSAILAPKFGVQWSIAPVAAVTFVMALVAFAVSFTLRKVRGEKAEPVAGRHAALTSASFSKWVQPLVLLVAFLLPAVLIVRRMVSIFGQPDAISQTYDNVFHLNAIRYILDSRDGSSLTLNRMIGGDFYPAGWHDLVSLVVQLTGVSIPTGVNAVNIAIAAVVWPLGCMLLARVVLGNKPAVLLGAGVLSASFGAFPILLINFGVLYPNFFGNAMVPATFAVAVSLIGVVRPLPQGKLLGVLTLLAMVPGIALAHPSALLAVVAATMLPLIYSGGRSVIRTVLSKKTLPAKAFRISIVIIPVVAYVILILKVWKDVTRPASESGWQPIETAAQALGEALTSAPRGGAITWALVILVLLGLFRLVSRPGRRWYLLSYITMVWFWLVAASPIAGEHRSEWTGVWYNDPPRLAALLPFVTLPIATAGAVWLWELGLALAPRVISRFRNSDSGEENELVRPLSAVLIGIVCVGILVGVTQRENVRQAAISAKGAYSMNSEAPLLSSDEKAVLEQVPRLVPAGAVVVGNPWNGSALVYAFANRQTLQLHMPAPLNKDGMTVVNDLDEARTDPSVCRAVKDLRVQYVLDFGHNEVHGGNHGYKGLDNLGQDGVAELVFQQGNAKLYKITAC